MPARQHGVMIDIVWRLLVDVQTEHVGGVSGVIWGEGVGIAGFDWDEMGEMMLFCDQRKKIIGFEEEVLLTWSGSHVAVVY